MANPLYGQNKADTLLSEISNVKVRQFKIDFGVQATGTATTETFVKGDTILSFSAVVGTVGLVP